MARPTGYDEKKASTILSLMVEGRSLKSICEQDDMPSMVTVYRWLHKYEAFSNNYAKAQADRATTFAEQILAISDDENADDVQRAKLRVDTRKWLMSRMDPKRYGDKVTQELTGEVKYTKVENVIVDPKRSET